MVIKTFRESLSGLILLLVPVTIVACVMSPEIVKIVYMRGQFTEADAYHTANALTGFAIGFALIAVREMYIRLHFSYQDTKMPMIANIAAVFLNGLLSLVLSKYIGVFGVSLATSLSIILTIFLLNRSVKKYIPEFRFTSLSVLFVKILPAGASAAIVAYFLKNMLRMKPIFEFAICALSALAVYLIVLIVLRCRELKEFFAKVKAALPGGKTE